MQTPDFDDTADRYVRAPAIDLDGSGLAWGWFWFGLAYFACAQISLGTALLPGGAGILWAPAGLAIAVVLRFGRRLLPGMLLGELMTAVVGGTAPLAALGAGAANLVAVALAAAWLGRLFVPPGWLQRSRDLTLFIGIAALGAPTLGVTLGMASQPTAPLFPLGWLSWWFSHALGVVLVGSLVTAWLDQPKPAAGGRTQFLLVFAANLAIAGLVFSGWLPPLAENFPLMLLLPGLLFAAARLPQRLLILVLLATTVIGILGTAHGFGPFVRPAPLQSQLLLQGFLLLLAAVPLLLRAVLAEGEAANLALAEYRRQLEERVQHATEAREAGRIWCAGGYRPFASEGSHGDFAPGNALGYSLHQWLARRYGGHVSWERVVSGPGLVNLHAFLRESDGRPAPDWLELAMQEGDPAGAIATAAQAQGDPVCVEALDLLIHYFGAEAGNHALKLMATGGVYLTGGIAPKIAARFAAAGFLDAFFAKGRMRELMRRMPVHLVTDGNLALYGAARCAARMGAG